MAEIRPQVSIALMGGTGTGKTTFANLAGRSQFLVEDGLKSCTNHVHWHQFALDGYNVKLIDVPGFNDTNKSDVDILKMIADFLLKEYQEGRPLSGIMYFHRISDVKVGGASRRNLMMFQKFCGEDAFENVAIVTTRWDLVDATAGEKRLAELNVKPQLFESILKGEPRSFAMTALLTLPMRFCATSSATPRNRCSYSARWPKNVKVSETAAGQELLREVQKHVERHQQEMMELREEMEQSRDVTVLEDLEEECQALRDRMAHWNAEAIKLSGTSMETALAVDISPQSSLKPMSIANDSSSARAASYSSPFAVYDTMPGGRSRDVGAETGKISEDPRRIPGPARLNEDQNRLANVSIMWEFVGMPIVNFLADGPVCNLRYVTRNTLYAILYSPSQSQSAVIVHNSCQWAVTTTHQVPMACRERS